MVFLHFQWAESIPQESAFNVDSDPKVYKDGFHLWIGRLGFHVWWFKPRGINVEWLGDRNGRTGN